MMIKYAVTLEDMFTGVRKDKIKIIENGNYKKEYKARDKRALAKKIFDLYFSNLLYDIIFNGSSVEISPYSTRSLRLEIDCYRKEAFNRLKQKGWFEGIDYIASNFTGYIMKLVYSKNLKVIRQLVYLNKDTRIKFLEKVNSGFVYRNNVHKTYTDYISVVYDEFDIVEKESIDYIIKYGLTQMYCVTLRGMPMHFESKLSNAGFFVGKKATNYINEFVDRYKYKVRYLASKGKGDFDGYYYFILSEEQNKIFQETGKIDTYLYRFKDEIYTFVIGEHIYRTKLDNNSRLKFYVTEYEKANAEYVSRRDKFRFKPADNIEQSTD